jgi:DNA-binding MurR/RpiR family transcriptional regulator
MPTYQDTIRQYYPRLSPSFRRVADFLLDNYHEAAFMTATQLADRLEVDPATIVRFAQRLGYPGYPELLIEIRQMVRSEMQRSLAEVSSEAGSADLLRSALGHERDNVERMRTQLLDGDVEGLTDAILRAQHIYVLGEGPSQSVAGLFAALLRESDLPAQAVPATIGEATRLIQDASTEDLLIGVSLLGLSPDVSNTLRIARRHGVRTVAIVGSPSAPPAQAAEIVIVCPSHALLNLPSYGGILTFIAALSQTLAVRAPERLAEFNTKFQEIYNQLSQNLLSEVRRVDISKVLGASGAPPGPPPDNSR